MKSRNIRSITAITWLLAVALLVIWLGAMFFSTGITAESLYSEICSQTYTQFIRQWGPDPSNGQMPKSDTHSILRRLDYCNDSSVYYSPGADFDSFRLIEEIPLQIAVTVTDGQGNLLFESGDYLYFDAHSQEQWDADEQPGRNSEFYYIPLTRNELYAPLYELYAEPGFGSERTIMRITGYPDGERFIPVQIDYVPEEESLYAYERYATDQGYSYITSSTYDIPISHLQEYFSWTQLLQQPNTSDTPLTTVYTYAPQMTIFSNDPITYQGTRYSSLLEALHQAEIAPEASIGSYDEDRLHRTVSFYRFYLADPEKPISNISDYDMIVTCAVYANPLKAAVRSLAPVYFLTGLLTLITGLILWITLHKKLILPMAAACDAIANDWDPNGTYHVTNWKEPAKLLEQIRAEDRHRRAAQDTITRLETALGYAQTAEENRRQMTSHIAHELKTPLAIIHSYCEGLQENIAEEKREQYLDTILAETERMDTMVMELLDLSRLEAGKVTLTRTEFSLSQLVLAQWKPFAPLAEQKGLAVTLELDDRCQIVADEARLEQVIRNFLSNAVHYTPENGTIRIQTQFRYTRLNRTFVFRVENSGHRFSDAELEKLWETFYRADPARSGKGTGLGLAISKNIVALHGGHCEAKNTDLGVEFSFSLT